MDYFYSWQKHLEIVPYSRPFVGVHDMASWVKFKIHKKIFFTHTNVSTIARNPHSFPQIGRMAAECLRQELWLATIGDTSTRGHFFTRNWVAKVNIMFFLFCCYKYIYEDLNQPERFTDTWQKVLEQFPNDFPASIRPSSGSVIGRSGWGQARPRGRQGGSKILGHSPTTSNQVL